MSDEHKLIRDSATAAQAQALLDNEMLKGAFDELEKAYTDQMSNTGVAEADTYRRDRLHQAIHILRKVKDGLKKHIENGKVAQAHLRMIQGKRAA